MSNIEYDTLSLSLYQEELSKNLDKSRKICYSLEIISL
jgi:hypothetical protein